MSLTDKIRRLFRLPESASEADLEAAIDAASPPAGVTALSVVGEKLKKPKSLKKFERRLARMEAALARFDGSSCDDDMDEDDDEDEKDGKDGKEMSRQQEPATFAALTAKVHALEAAKAVLEQERKTERDEARQRDARRLVETFEREGKITPAMRKATAGDGEEYDPVLQFALADPVSFQAAYRAAPVLLNNYRSSLHPSEAAESAESGAAAFEQLIQTYEAAGLDYREAALRASEERPDLFHAHRQSVLTGRE